MQPEKDIQLYTCTEDAWEVMLKDILSAEKSIYIEQYIFMHDETGDRFIDALIQKSKQGLEVRLLLDAVGSYSFYNSTTPSELRDMGIKIQFFNPISPWRVTNFTSNFFRDHRKIMIVDGAIAHIGGVGIEDKMAKWRDTHMRITGPLVADVVQSFEIMWRGVRRWSLLRFQRLTFTVKKYNILTNAPVFRQRYMYQALLGRIRNAKKYIYLTSPYFIPDPALFRAMRLAALRGVDVRLMLPSIADHIAVDFARQSFFTRALKAGIRIYEYQEVMMHAKSAVIDDTWATAGSFNLDSLSFFYNYEINVASEDSEFIEEIKKHFHHDITKSKEVHYKEWLHRPLRNKFLEMLTMPFHWIM